MKTKQKVNALCVDVTGGVAKLRWRYDDEHDYEIDVVEGEPGFFQLNELYEAEVSFEAP